MLKARFGAESHSKKANRSDRQNSRLTLVDDGCILESGDLRAWNHITPHVGNDFDLTYIDLAVSPCLVVSEYGGKFLSLEDTTELGEQHSGQPGGLIYCPVLLKPLDAPSLTLQHTLKEAELPP